MSPPFQKRPPVDHSRQEIPIKGRRALAVIIIRPRQEKARSTVIEQRRRSRSPAVPGRVGRRDRGERQRGRSAHRGHAAGQEGEDGVVELEGDDETGAEVAGWPRKAEEVEFEGCS